MILMVRQKSIGNILNDIRMWIRDWLKQPLKLEYKISEECLALREVIQRNTST
jgi:hypothetical protein